MCMVTAMLHTAKDGTRRRRFSLSRTVRDSSSFNLPCGPSLLTHRLALALAMARDGSSGGCIRMCVITKDKVERHFVPGNELPRFWEGKEVVAQNTNLFKSAAVSA